MTETVRLERETNRCSSCGVRLVGSRTTVFNCPSCGGDKVGRCEQCRDQSVKYSCPACGFAGP